MTESQWHMKILSGTHQGAEIQLPEGQQKIGQGDDCDIILHDESISTLQMAIDINDEGLFIRNLDPSKPFLYQGEPVDQESFQPDTSKVVSIGNLEFGFFKEGEGWVNPAQAQPHLTTIDDEFSPVPIGDEPVLEPETSSGKWKVALIGLAAMILAGIWAANQDLLTSDDSATNKDELAELLKAPSYQHLTISGTEGTRLIKGYVMTNKELKELKAALAQGSGTSVDLKVRSIESFENAAKLGLSGFGFNDIEVKGDQEKMGTIILKGYVKDKKRWMKAKKSLIQDLQAIPAWDDQVSSLQDQIATLNQEIDQKGLKGKIKLTAKQNQIEVQGMLNPKEQGVWKKIYQNFRKDNGDKPNFTDARARIGDMEIKSVSLGKQPYLVMSNGERVMIGGLIAQTYTVHQIKEDRVVLQQRGKLYNYYLDEANDQ